MSRNLMVDLSRTITIDSPNKEEGVGSKYLDVSLQYIPSSCEDADKLTVFESNDRSWVKLLVELNPSINNLSEVVNAAAKKLIDEVKPSEVSLVVRLSNDADCSGFCSKTVHFNWSKEDSKACETNACSAS